MTNLPPENKSRSIASQGQVESLYSAVSHMEYLRLEKRGRLPPRVLSTAPGAVRRTTATKGVGLAGVFDECWCLVVPASVIFFTVRL